MPRDWRASALKPTRELREKEETRGDAANFEEVMLLRREVEDLKGRLERREAEAVRVGMEKESLKGKCKRRGDRVARGATRLGGCVALITRTSEGESNTFKRWD